MTAPARLQLSRAAGWRKPEGAVVVSRPSIWGNPWPVERVAGALLTAMDWGSHPERGRDLWAAKHFNHREGRESAGAAYKAALDRLAAEAAVAQFRALAEHFERADPERFANWIAPLKGRDLLCWCKVIFHGDYVPCHADVLLSIANNISMEEVICENIRRAEGETL